jgi:hypothetical protein
MAQVVYDGAILDRVGKWDSYPSHLFYGGKHHIWWCSRSSVQGSLSTFVDGIFHAVKTGSLGTGGLGGWTGYTEVFNHTQSPWSSNHTCDPSVVLGTFSYNGKTYSMAMYWTSDTNMVTAGVDNAVGVAFSNDGIAWTPYPFPVITTYNSPNGTYGAGAGSVNFDPTTGRLVYAYDDTTLSPVSRLKQTTDGISFVPTPPYATQLSAAGPGQGSAPDIAYNPQNLRWYAVVQVLDQEILVLRASNQNDLFGPWDLIGVFDSTITRNASNNNPGLGKIANGTLYIDAQGWAYAFFGTGTSNASTWQVAQGRFRP